MSQQPIHRLMNKLADMRHELGLNPTLIAFAVALRMKDERVLAFAREHVDGLGTPYAAPDWVRCLAQASSVEAIDDAFDDLAQEPGWGFLTDGQWPVTSDQLSVISDQ